MSLEIPGVGLLETYLLSGVSTGCDIMRGEETELVGITKLVPELAERGDEQETLVILPGTHSKHCVIRGQHLVDFTTYMTGELYMHLHKMPTLTGIFAADANLELDETAFLGGVDQARNQTLSAALFRIRSRAILSPDSSTCAQSFLSGLLIGSELLPYVSSRYHQIYIHASGPLAQCYRLAASRFALPAIVLYPDIFPCMPVVAGHAVFLTRVNL